MPLQAYLAQEKYRAAVGDLQKSVALASVDEKGTIQAVLDKALANDPSGKPVRSEEAAPAPPMPTEVEEPASPTGPKSMDGDIEVCLCKADCLH